MDTLGSISMYDHFYCLILYSCSWMTGRSQILMLCIGMTIRFSFWKKKFRRDMECK